jgi:hypothetical protein
MKKHKKTQGLPTSYKNHTNLPSLDTSVVQTKKQSF